MSNQATLWRYSARAGRIALLFGATALTCLTACSDSATSGQSCTSSLDCPTLTVCTDSVCGAKSCDPQQGLGSDCGQNAACTAGGKCTPMECGCIDCAECAAGLTCMAGLCVDKPGGDCAGETCLDKPCTDDAACGGLECWKGGKCKHPGYCEEDGDCSTKKCDLTTNTCAANDTPDPDAGPIACTADSCAEGEVCNEETGECETKVTSGSTLCKVCESDAQCGGDEQTSCVAFGGGKYCLSECETNNDCPTGYKCYEGAGNRCIPGSATCEKKCIQEGCPDGKVCEFSTGNCVAQLKACDSCSVDDNCGEGSRCVKFATNDKRCMPECDSGGGCPAGSTCGTEEQVKVCKPTGAQCCFGEDCGGTAQCDDCPPGAPACFEGQCVQCINDSVCAGSQKCNPDTHQCETDVGPQNCDNCSGDTPLCHPQQQKCVQCLNSTHCGSGQICDPSTSTCTGDICAACVDEYPKCAEINGEKSCVQCVQNEDCPSNQCVNYWCEGGGVITPTGNCQTEGCPTSAQFTLACDQSSGLCYDTAGACDNITAFCDAASGSECISMFDIFAGGAGGGGGGGAGIPGLPTGGAFGVCTCDALGGALCGIDPSLCASTGKCFGGMSCSPLGLLMALLGGTSTGNFDTSSFCTP